MTGVLLLPVFVKDRHYLRISAHFILSMRSVVSRSGLGRRCKATSESLILKPSAFYPRRYCLVLDEKGMVFPPHVSPFTLIEADIKTDVSQRPPSHTFPDPF